MSLRWRVYACEAALLGLFMMSACTFGMLMEYPGSPLRGAIENVLVRRALMGIAMGATAVALIYSPMGMRSGAHMNPSVTLCFLRMGRIGRRDAACYVAAQFIGGAVATVIVALVAGMWLRHPRVNVVATVPGARGVGVAWIAEFAIAFVLMNVVMTVNKVRELARFTGVFAGALVAVYITLEAPLSGMSMNPARTVASAFVAQVWTGLWIYFTAPVLGMLAAVEAQRLVSRHPHRLCGKLSHSRRAICIFKCDCLEERNK